MSAYFSGLYSLKPALLLFKLLLLPPLQAQGTECTTSEKYNLTVPIGSSILLPCYFPSELRNSTFPNHEIIWIKNENEYLVEISSLGEKKFWKNYHTRLEISPPMATRGNFSLLLKNASVDDAGNYHCRLFNGLNCKAEYKVIQLDVVTKHDGIQGDNKPAANIWKNVTFLIAVGSGCGGIIVVAVVCLLVACRARRKRRSQHRQHHSVQMTQHLANSAPTTEFEYSKIYNNVMYKP